MEVSNLTGAMRMGGLGLLLLALSCADSSQEKIALAKAGLGCSLSSDCAEDLVCAFQRCHVECNDSRDCNRGGNDKKLRCMLSSKPAHVCQLEDEVSCRYNSECPGAQVCGIDGECRDACLTPTDCVPGQECTGGTCADGSELDENGLLRLSSSAPDGPGRPCLYTSQCGAPLVCRSGTCVEECLGDRDCSAGSACEESACTAALASGEPPGGAGAGGNGGGGGAAGAEAGSGGATAGGSAAGNTNAPAGSMSPAPLSNHCANGRQDEGESDLDCGGPCFPCSVGAACGAATDCTSARCSSQRCAAPSCDDGVRNGREAGMDCGGDCPTACAQPAACASAGACGTGQACVGAQCRADHCADEAIDGGETGLDCGGAECAPCADFGRCATDGDCRSGRCTAGVCAAPTCTDRILNGDEAAIDCGGACAACAAGTLCANASDCASHVCSGGVCALPTCNDGERNGLETAMDCGGSSCKPCASGSSCTFARDCATGSCREGHCVMPEGCMERTPALEVVDCTGTFTSEQEPNDSYPQATPICTGQVSGMLPGSSEVDLFSFRAPNVPYGGYLVATFSAQTGSTTVRALNGVEIRELTNQGGVVFPSTRTLWFATAPGERYFIKFEPGPGQAGAYTLTTSWYPVFDCFEPNDKREDAKRIALGESVSAFAHTAALGTGDQPFDDWYVVTLEAGTTTVDVSNVALDVQINGAQFYDLSGQTVGGGKNASWGVSLSFQTQVAKGTYRLLVRAEASRGGKDTLGEHLTQPYVVRVSQ